MTRRRAAAACLGLLVGLLETGARAQLIEIAAAPAPPAPAPAPGPAPVWTVAMGLRTMYVKSAGLDPFSTDDALSQFSLAGTYAFMRRGRLALAAGLELDVGGTGSAARGAASSLSLTTISAVLEGRYQAASRFQLFARLSPGLLHGAASISDPSGLPGAGLGESFDTFSLEAAAGGAFALTAIPGTRVRIWLLADGGYSWAAAQHLLLAPGLGADQNKAGALDLGTLAPRGGFFRLAAALSYD
ncbi:MAG TPA: hypothetical protein VMT03_09820 [Polyangia bacterium]|nr:hypothetical protein [Polyangia bacterium]